MEIRLATTMGFCRGVSRAVKMATEALAIGKKEHTPVYALGPLIHNPQTIEQFARDGLILIDEPEEVPPGTVILRAHGISDTLRERIRGAGHQIVDATCPVVTRNLSQIARYSTTHHVLIVGHEGHPETMAMQGVHTEDGTLVPTRLITDVASVGALAGGAAYAVFVQTTYAQKPWQAIQEQLSEQARMQGAELLFASAICVSSQHRRTALLALSEVCDGIIIIGGKESANTRALYELARSTGVKAWHIEGAKEVDEVMRHCAILGITAGASTPDSVVQAVVDALRLR
ncbi:MAG TPA: 4-hydroxy-3-methylbut-2-enyl diphosphate reductase [Sphaerochaeta sp.]|nr:4-hydroxy-3-methylbut-2-enyl diphosphate reductase [Sphaerochaeta sp.]